MQFPHINPVFLKLGPLQFRWYGLMYILGFLISYFVIRSRVRSKNIIMSNEEVSDLIFSLALGVIIGGRCGYILFYDLSLYLANPLKIFAVWEGGMSFHGGLIGAALTGTYYVRKHHLPYLRIADSCFLAAPLGLFLGRIGNFINGELYGRITDLPWGIIFPSGGNLPRHPSQLYEAILEGPLTFAILWVIERRKAPDGVIVWAFIALYGLFRFCVEFVREPDSQLGFVLGPLSMGQLLSLPMFLLGVALVMTSYRHEKQKGSPAETR